MGEIITFEPGTEATALELAPLLRAEDVQELWASSRSTGIEALRRGVELSDFSVAIRLAGEMAAMFGIARPKEPAPLLGLWQVGCIWFLTGEACDKHQVSLLKASRRVVPAIHRASRCIEIMNWMDARYEKAMTLAKFVGFEIVGTSPHGPDGIPFHLVSRRM